MAAAGKLQLTALMAELRSHAERLGVIEKTTGHEPKNAPGRGVRGAFWAVGFKAATGMHSGLASTSVVVIVNCRLSVPMSHQSADDIDPMIMAAADQLCGAYVEDFTLSGLANVRAIDVRAMAGVPLSCDFGYLEIDKIMFRVATIVLPVIYNDVWTESP